MTRKELNIEEMNSASSTKLLEGKIYNTKEGYFLIKSGRVYYYDNMGRLEYETDNLSVGDVL